MAATKDIMELVKSKKAALQAQSGRNREKTVKPPVGRSKWRILPGWRGADDATFFHDFGQHFIKDVHGALKAVYVCTEKTFGKPCPICEAINEGISVSENDDVINALKEGKSKGRILLNALHLDGENPTQPVILDLTPTTFEKVLDLIEEWGNITDLENGVDIVINRSGKGINTEYTVTPAPKSAPVQKSVLKSLHNLDDYVKQEYDEGRVKALGAVNAVAGLLSAPGDKPRTALPADCDDDIPAHVERSSSIPADYRRVEVEDVPSAEAPTARASEDLSDDELNDLLADLEG